MSCLLVPFYLASLRKKKTKGKDKRGEEGGKEGKVIPFLFQGTLKEQPFRKGKGARNRNVSCLFVPFIGLP